MTRDEAIAQAVLQAEDRAIQAGADKNSIKVVEMGESYVLNFWKARTIRSKTYITGSDLPESAKPAAVLGMRAIIRKLLHARDDQPL